MCCKFPPATFLPLYLIVTALVIYYLQKTEAIYLIGPANCRLKHIEDCRGFYNPNFELKLDMDTHNDVTQLIIGNVSFNFDFDESILVTLKGVPSYENDPKKEKYYINKKSFCRILDNFLLEHFYKDGKDISTFCPIKAGFYVIRDITPGFNEVSLPYEMLGHKKFRMELSRDEEVIACKQFEVENTLYDVDGAI